MRTHDPLMPILRQLTNRDRTLLGLLYDHKVLTTEQITTFTDLLGHARAHPDCALRR